jgi:hypothetical protein
MVQAKLCGITISMTLFTIRSGGLVSQQLKNLLVYYALMENVLMA